MSLVWRSGELVDWVAGGLAYRLDGTRLDRAVAYSYPFDAAVGSPSGRYAVIYQRLGTKGLLLRDGDILRELNRSFYHADVYEYPVCLFALPDGREVIAHCPDEYCDLVIDDARTGERLTVPQTGRLQSNFHSRLAAHPSGRRLLSAGWVWHPVDVAVVFDVQADPGGRLRLAEPDGLGWGSCEVSAATFVGDRHLLVVSSRQAEDFNDDEPDPRLRPGRMGLWSLDAVQFDSLTQPEDEVGEIMAVSHGHAVGFYDHPKLFDLRTGRVVCRWPDLKTGRQLSSIIWHMKDDDRPPPIALDPDRRRFAVAGKEKITVITLSDVW